MISRVKSSKRVIRKYAYWMFAIGMGAILIVLEDSDAEPLFSITAFFYFALLFYWGVAWLVKQIKSVIKLKNETAKAELSHLQSQVNPHFFFNMLNNLYGLVETDSKKAQQLILKLSDMMRYSIYEGQRNLVTVDAEVEYLKNYIELHKMRYHKKIEVEFNPHLQAEECKVMPLLFIILLENAFKHGIEKLRENAYVHINLIAGPDNINFSVENNFDANKIPKQPGIGLKNLKRRLELAYPDKHSLSFSNTTDVYKAQLSLKLI